MARRLPHPRIPISYSVEGAADAVGLSIGPINDAIRNGDLTPRWSGNKRLIEHDDLVGWVKTLPLEKPSADKA